MRKVALALAAAALACLGGLGVWTVVQAAGLLDTTGSDRSAALQALAAGASLLATVLLLAMTGWYTWLTERALRQSGPDVTVTLGGIHRVLDPSVEIDPLSALWGLDLLGPAVVYDAPTFVERQPEPTTPGTYLELLVRNAGNSPTSVEAIGVEFPRGYPLMDHDPQHTFELDAHSSMHLTLEWDQFDNVRRSWRRQPVRMRVVVLLGSGRVVKSRWRGVP